MVAGAAQGWLGSGWGRTLVVLGADGFIGSWVVRLGLVSGARVVGLCVKQPWRLEGVVDDDRLVLEAVPAGRWWEPAYRRELHGHLRTAAALVHLGYEPPPVGLDVAARHQHEQTVNAAGAAHVAATAAAASVTVVLASSADVYGPWHERPVDERTPPAPATPYAEAKLAAEQMTFGARAPIAICLRIATVFGPGELGPRAIPSFVRALADGRPAQVHGDGADVRDYVAVTDVAAGLVNAALSPGPGARVLTLGSGVGRTTTEVLGAVAAVLGIAPRAQHVPATRPPSRLVVSGSAAHRALGFTADPAFDDGIAREAGWLLAHRERWP